MKFAIDTNIFSAFEAGDDRLRHTFGYKNEIILPLIVVGELRGGYAAGRYRSYNEDLLRRFLDRANVTTVSLTDQITTRYGEIYAHLKKVGKPIQTNDMWIAALCIEHKIPLLTLDKHFSAIPDLELMKI